KRAKSSPADLRLVRLVLIGLLNDRLGRVGRGRRAAFTRLGIRVVWNFGRGGIRLWLIRLRRRCRRWRLASYWRGRNWWRRRAGPQIAKFQRGQADISPLGHVLGQTRKSAS